MSPRRTFTYRDVDIFRPYPDEIPWELLEQVGSDTEAVDVDLLRVAKLDGEPVGVYQLGVRSATCYVLVSLAVVPECRRRGLGRWLLGHAIGIAESKGAREIRIAGAPLKGLFQRSGFVADADELVLRLMPE